MPTGRCAPRLALDADDGGALERASEAMPDGRLARVGTNSSRHSAAARKGVLSMIEAAKNKRAVRAARAANIDGDAGRQSKTGSVQERERRRRCVDC